MRADRATLGVPVGKTPLGLLLHQELMPDRPDHPRITYLPGSSADAWIFARVRDDLGDGSR